MDITYNTTLITIVPHTESSGVIGQFEFSNQ